MTEAQAAVTETVIETAPEVTRVALEDAEAPANDVAATPANDTTPAPEENSLAIAKRFEAAKKVDIRNRRIAEKVRAEREAVARERQELEALKAKIKEDADLLEANPIEWAARRKQNPDLFAKRILEPKSPLEEKLEQLEAKLAEKEELTVKEQKERAEAEKHQRMRSFVSEITPDECPHLTTLYEAHEVPALLERELAKHGKAFIEEYGRHPTNQELRAHLERMAAAKVQKFKAAPASAVIDGQGSQASNGPNTLTNNHAAQAASGKPRAKTREERRAELIAQLEAEERAAR